MDRDSKRSLFAIPVDICFASVPPTAARHLFPADGSGSSEDEAGDAAKGLSRKQKKAKKPKKAKGKGKKGGAEDAEAQQARCPPQTSPTAHIVPTPAGGSAYFFKKKNTI